MTTKNFFIRTRAALDIYDADISVRMARWQAAETEQEVRACEEMDVAALMKVQDAFFEDTKAVNTLSHCRAIGIAGIREIIAAAKKQV